jgi:hypothetical protein
MKTITSSNESIPQDLLGRRSTVLPVAGARLRAQEDDRPPLNEVIPLWFALSSPLTGLILGLLGAWFFTWLTT